VNPAVHKGELLAPGGAIQRDDLWVPEHIVEPIPMAGRLVLKPVRRVERFAELMPEEARFDLVLKYLHITATRRGPRN
jgi:hypothetical protein